MFELNMKPTRSNCFEIRSSDDALTTIDCRNEKHSQFELAGVTYSIEREPRWGDWVLSRDGHELCRATKPSAFSSRTQLALATSNRRSSISVPYVRPHVDSLRVSVRTDVSMSPAAKRADG